MTSSKVGQLKPFMIEEKKEGPDNVIQEVTANKWNGSILANIKKEEKWVALISRTWEPKKVTKQRSNKQAQMQQQQQLKLT